QIPGLKSKRRQRPAPTRARPAAGARRAAGTPTPRDPAKDVGETPRRRRPARHGGVSELSSEARNDRVAATRKQRRPGLAVRAASLRFTYYARAITSRP